MTFLLFCFSKLDCGWEFLNKPPNRTSNFIKIIFRLLVFFQFGGIPSTGIYHMQLLLEMESFISFGFLYSQHKIRRNKKFVKVLETRFWIVFSENLFPFINVYQYFPKKAVFQVLDLFAQVCPSSADTTFW